LRNYFRDGIVIAINDAIQVSREMICYFIEFVVIEFAIFDKFGEGERGQITHCDLISRCVLPQTNVKTKKIRVCGRT
jgi:hypothetical protein